MAGTAGKWLVRIDLIFENGDTIGFADNLEEAKKVFEKWFETAPETKEDECEVTASNTEDENDFLVLAHNPVRGEANNCWQRGTG